MSSKLFFNSIILVVLFLGTTQIGFSQTKPKTVKAEIKTTLYCDHCSKCESCALRIKAGLRKLKGFQLFNVDEAKMIFHVTYDLSKLDLNTSKKEITLMGFDADEMKADMSAYKKLDGCCKK